MSSPSNPSPPPPGGGQTNAQNGQDCTSQQGAQQLLCLIANPYASSVCAIIILSTEKVADKLHLFSSKKLQSSLRWATQLES